MKQALQQRMDGPTLSDRIEALRAEINALIDARVREIAKDAPGVPEGVIRNILVARGGGCECQQYLALVKSERA